MVINRLRPSCGPILPCFRAFFCWKPRLWGKTGALTRRGSEMWVGWNCAMILNDSLCMKKFMGKFDIHHLELQTQKMKKPLGMSGFFQKPSKTSMMISGHIDFFIGLVVHFGRCRKSMGDMVRSNRPCHHVWRSLGWSNTRRRFLEPSEGDGAGMSTWGGCGLTSLNFGGENYRYIFQ